VFADSRTRESDIKACLDRFCRCLAEGPDGEAKRQFSAFLEHAASFWRYSWCNTLLIAVQRPNARIVAGYRAWQKQGRHVKAGEKAIWIWAPRIVKERVIREREDGTPEEVEAESMVGYVTVPVFDVSQTEGTPLPSWRPEVEGAAEALPALLGVARSLGFEVTERLVPIGVNDAWAFAGGMAVNGTKRIELRPEVSDASKAATLVHEVAHHLLGHVDRKERDGAPSVEEARKAQALREGEAETVTVVVGGVLWGHNVGTSTLYLRGYGVTAQDVRASLGRVSKVSRTILATYYEQADASARARAA
jgi:N-terminal domain of anti-restriction factor ArdC